MTYTFLATGRDEAGLRELQLALAPPDQKEEIIDRANAAAMASMGIGMIGPRPGMMPKPKGA